MKKLTGKITNARRGTGADYMFFAAMPSFGGSISFVYETLIYIANSLPAKAFFGSFLAYNVSAYITMRMLWHKFTAPNNEEDDGERDPIGRCRRCCNGYGTSPYGSFSLLF